MLNYSCVVSTFCLFRNRPSTALFFFSPLALIQYFPPQTIGLFWSQAPGGGLWG